MVWGERWDGGSGWGTRVRLWRIHVDVWQNQYNILKYLECPVQDMLMVAEWL